MTRLLFALCQSKHSVNVLPVKILNLIFVRMILHNKIASEQKRNIRRKSIITNQIANNVLISCKAYYSSGKKHQI